MQCGRLVGGLLELDIIVIYHSPHVEEYIMLWYADKPLSVLEPA